MRQRHRAFSGCGAILICALWPLPALAQNPVVPLPPPTDLARPQAPLAPPRNPVRQRRAPEIAMPENAATTMIDVSAVTLEGVTVYPGDTLAREYAGLVGRRVALSELFEAAARIEARYRADGYPLARAIVPPQDVGDGHYRIRIVEGYVSDVSIEGDPGAARGLLQRMLALAGRAQPARIADIERALLLANDLPGYEVSGVLTPDPAAPGAARLVVSVRRRPLGGFVTLNNRGSRAAGPQTGTVGLSINGIGGFGGHIGAIYYSTFDKEQNYAELSFDGRIGHDGLKLRGWASYDTSSPGSILAPLDIKSRSLLVGLGLEYPIIRGRGVNLAARGSFEIGSDRTRILGTPSSRDRERVIRIGLDGSVRDGWNGTTSLGVTLHKGLDILNASHDGDRVPQTRFGGRSDFFKATVTAARAQQLWAGQGDGLALVVSGSAQFAGNRLLSAEQFHLGGEQFGRGFNPAQITGDNGYAGSLELQFTHYGPIGPIAGAQVYGFVDAMRIEDRGAAAWQSYQSAGGGVRFDLGRHLSGQFEVAVPYKRGRQIDARLDTGPQAFFRITARY